jgi:hypothetical protein
MLGLQILRGIGRRLGFNPSPCPSPLRRGDGVQRTRPSFRGSLSHGERDRVRGNVLGLALIAALFAALTGTSVRAESDLLPHPPKARGERCVANTDFMRRYHMTTLKHERDETVHEGVRGGKFSLKGCMDCHAVKGANGKPVSYESPKHFCRSCHDYAAVSLDCFECHASRPGEKSPHASLAPASGSGPSTALASYHQGSHP